MPRSARVTRPPTPHPTTTAAIAAATPTTAPTTTAATATATPTTTGTGLFMVRGGSSLHLTQCMFRVRPWGHKAPPTMVRAQVG